MSTMTTFRSTTSTRPLVAVTSDAKLAGTGLLDAAFGGSVTFAKVRETGTLRTWPVLAPKSPMRELAEAIEKARQGGDTVEAIAQVMHKSVPTIRRLITSLAFTRELEGMTAKERAALAKSAVANAKAMTEKSAPAKPAPAKEATAKAEPKAPAKPKAPKETNNERLARIKRERAEKAAAAEAAKAAEEVPAS